MKGNPWDRRARQRMKLPYSIVLYRLGEAAKIETTTEDISSEGFYCISEQPFSPNEKLECEVIIPSEDRGPSLEDSLVLRCRAEVIRVVADGLKPGFGLACRLQDYKVGRQNLKQHPAPQVHLQQV
jgi:PilZ domain